MIEADQAQKLWDLIKSAEVGMLVMQDDGVPSARPMHIAQDEFNGALWFFTKRNSGKSETLASGDETVCVTFADHAKEKYVSITGTAALDRDQSLIDRFWNPFVAAWFPEGKDSPNVTLIRIDVTQAEYWDATASRMVQMFKMLKSNITKREPDLGTHKKIGSVR